MNSTYKNLSEAYENDIITENDISNLTDMTFLYRDRCIFQLHSSVLPELNQSLLNIKVTQNKN